MKRKLMSSLLAASLIFSLSAPALAVEGEIGSTPISASQEIDGVKYITVQIKKLAAAQNYSAYKILDVIPTSKLSGDEGSGTASKMYSYTVVKNAAGKIDENVAAALNEVAANRSWSNSKGESLEALYTKYTTNGSQSTADYDRAVYDFISGTGNGLLKDSNVPGDYRDKNDPSEWVSTNDALKLARELEAALRKHSVSPIAFEVEAMREGEEAYQSYTGTSGLVEGYYLFSQSDTDDTSGTTRSLFMLNTASGIDGILQINPKVGVPTVDKTIRVPDADTDKINTEDDGKDDNAWDKKNFTEAGVASGKSEVEFKIVCTVPENIQQYEENDYFPFVVHDTMVGADIKFIDSVADFEVWIDPDGPVRHDNTENPEEVTGGSTAPFKVDKIRNHIASTDEEPSYAGFQYWGENPDNADCLSGKHNVHFGVGNLFDIMKEHSAKMTKDGTITFYYRAIVNGENAVIGGNGNPNEALVEYGNDPYWKYEPKPGEPENPPKDPKDPKPTTEETSPNYAVFFTFRSEVNKVDGNNNPLAGAEFTIQKLTKEGDTYKWVTKESFDLTNADKNSEGAYIWKPDVTQFNFKTLNDGIYRFKETKTPDGYNTAADVYFEIYKGIPAISITDSEGNPVDPTWEDIEEKDLNTLVINNMSFTNLKTTDEYKEDDTGLLVGSYNRDTWFETVQKDGKDDIDIVNDGDTSHTFETVYSTSDGSGTTAIVNLPGNLLPSTGGTGTMMMYIGGGAALMVALGAAFVLKKKKENEAA